jgi:hypothetical protein
VSRLLGFSKINKGAFCRNKGVDSAKHLQDQDSGSRKGKTNFMIELSQNPTRDVAAPIVSAPDLSAPTPDMDPLRCGIPLPYRAVFYPLGFAVQVITNEEAVLAIVDECWGGGLRQLHTNPMVEVRIVVSEGGSAECPPVPVLSAQRHLFTIVADAHNHAVCDFKQGLSLVWLNYAALQHPKYLCYHFIETAACSLIQPSYATAIHAACVSRGGHGMLLTGDSGAGKSSLAYACARAGWTFTSDDGSWLLRDGDQPRVVGNCRQVRFRPTAKDLFPELRGRDLTPRVQGKPSIEIPTSELGLITAEQATIRSVIFLNRQPSAVAELLPLPRGTAFQRFRDSLVRSEEIRQLHIEVLQQLSAVDVYELRYTELDSAIDRLQRLVREGHE